MILQYLVENCLRRQKKSRKQSFSGTEQATVILTFLMMRKVLVYSLLEKSETGVVLLRAHMLYIYYGVWFAFLNYIRLMSPKYHTSFELL